MKDLHIIVLTVILTLLGVGLLIGSYFLGEARMAFLVQQIQFAISQENR